MSGLDRAVYLQQFSRAEVALRKAGFSTMNPCRFIFCRWPWLFNLLGYKLCLLIDLWMVAKCDYIYLISPDWRDSRGARIERFWAKNMGVRRLSEGVQRIIDIEVLGNAPQPAAPSTEEQIVKKVVAACAVNAEGTAKRRKRKRKKH